MLPETTTVRRTRARAALVLLGTFALGVATGVGGYGSWRSYQRNQRMGSGGVFFSRDGFLRLYDRSLGLTDAQKEQLGPVFDRHAAAFIALNRKSLPDHVELNRALDAELLHVLTPEQMPKFTTMQEGREKFLRGWAGEAPPAAPSQQPAAPK